jgi:hypothetical protein
MHTNKHDDFFSKRLRPTGLDTAAEAAKQPVRAPTHDSDWRDSLAASARTCSCSASGVHSRQRSECEQLYHWMPVHVRYHGGRDLEHGEQSRCLLHSALRLNPNRDSVKFNSGIKMCCCCTWRNVACTLALLNSFATIAVPRALSTHFTTARKGATSDSLNTQSLARMTCADACRA